MTNQAPRRDRAAVRDALVSILVAGVPALEGRVYRSRMWPINPALGPSLRETPAALVYASPETKARQHARGSIDKIFRTSCELTVIVRDFPAPGDGPPEVRLEAQLEQLAGTVEAVVLTTPEFINGAIEDIGEVRTEIAMDAEGGNLAGAVVLTFTAEWSEQWSMPDPAYCEDPTITLAPLPPMPA